MSQHWPAAPALAAGLDLGGSKAALGETDEQDPLPLRDVVQADPSDPTGQAIVLTRLDSNGRLALVGTPWH